MRQFVPFVLGLALAVCSAHAEDKKIPSQSVGGLPDVKDGATIKGVVLFKGDKPEAKPLVDVAGSAFCKEHHKDSLPVKETFSFGKNGDKTTVRNVLVYISKGLENKDFDPPKTPVILDQVGCVYVPHVVAVMAGQTLTVRNSDATLHNVMATPRENTPFNFGMPVEGGTDDMVFKVPEMKINTKCFMHPWMSAYIHVLETPFFAVTGEDGTFTIKGLPPGNYELSVLHESSVMEADPPVARLELKAGQTTSADFTYHLKKE